MQHRVGVIVPAAGRGERMGAGVVKALRQVDGVPLVVHALRALTAVPEVAHAVVAAPDELLDDVRRLLDAADLGISSEVVVGGADRRTSVGLALAALPAGVDTVLVHDAARAFVPGEVVARVLAALAEGAPACIPVLPVSDTVKRVDGDRVVETVDRSALWAVQTPQGFDREVLRRAHAAGGPDVTDDAGLVERLGLSVHVVAGHEEAFKVTRPIDLLLAEALVTWRTTKENA